MSAILELSKKNYDDATALERLIIIVWGEKHSDLTEEAANELHGLRSKLDDLEWEHDQSIRVTRMVMDEKCPSDEHHCTCVPILREEVARLKEKERLYDKLVADLTTKA